MLNRALQNDDIFIDNKIVSLSTLTGMKTRKGLEQAVICGNSIINVVSRSYGHLPNERYFLQVEEALINAEINYKTRSINRENRSFAVDYILDDERYSINIKNGLDKIRPMLRFVNSYDGSAKTSGHFGFFREVCSNGLHVAQQNIGFGVKHKGDIINVVLPEIKAIVNSFMDNEYFSLTKKFESLCEQKIHNVPELVKEVAQKTKLFKFESSDLNPDPSINARLIMEVMNRETALLNEVPNKWIAYNAFNEIIHGKLKMTFDKQRTADRMVMELIEAI